MEDRERNKEFTEHYLACYSQLEKYCRALTADDESAKELIAETVAKAFENFEKMRDKSKFKFYLFSISSNLFKKRLRDRKVHVELSDIEHLASNPDNWRSDIDLLYKSIASLNENQREIVTLFELSGFKLQEIAEMKKMPLNTVKTHLSRAREALRLIINPSKETIH